jgi:hypothetical protein
MPEIINKENVGEDPASFVYFELSFFTITDNEKIFGSKNIFLKVPKGEVLLEDDEDKTISNVIREIGKMEWNGYSGFTTRIL